MSAGHPITAACLGLLLALARPPSGLAVGDRESIIQTGQSRAPSPVVATRGGPQPARDEQQQVEPEWDYEPRVWRPDEPAADEEEPSDLFAEERLPFGSGQQHANEPAQPSSATWSESRPRNASYFWDSRRRNYGNVEVWPRQNSGETNCTQFRVDIRETVICDKRRCDKLDFEWPKHRNQLVVIETTKHGMRFHRSEYEFGAALAAGPARRALSSAQKISPPIKFDLFDLFKPKPTNSPAPTAAPVTSATSEPTTSTTSATSTSTATPEQTSTTTTAPPGGSTTPDGQPQTTTPADEMGQADGQHDGGQSTASSRDQALDAAQDNNQTRLVTTFRLNSGRRMQQIIGFGGALSDSTCRNIKSLSVAMSRSLMEDYFGQRGLRYNIARMTMGSSDFSASPYTNNDKQPPVPAAVSEPAKEADDDWRRWRRWRHHHGHRHSHTAAAAAAYDEVDDVEMKNFHLTEEDFEFKLPVARQAIATSQQPIKFYSSLWSPPTWMKNNSDIVHGWLKGDVYGPYYKALAELMLRWLEAYRRQGIEFWATTGLNEPVTGIKPFIFHNSLGMSREDYITFIKLHLGPMLRQRGFKDLKLIALDDNKGYAPTWAKSLLADGEAAKFVSGIGVHWYMNDEYENLNFLAKDHPDKFILPTEACNGYLPFQVHTLPGDWDRGVAYLYDIIKLMHKNAAGWVDWNMALDLNGGPSWIKNNLDAPIIVNAERDEYYKSPMFYAIGHFSRFVEPGSHRLDHRLAYAKYDYPLEAVAYITPRDQIVIVVLNANKFRIPFKIIVDRQIIKVVNLRADSFSTIIFDWSRNRNIK